MLGFISFSTTYRASLTFCVVVDVVDVIAAIDIPSDGTLRQQVIGEANVKGGVLITDE